jgi:hypothetical protein
VTHFLHGESLSLLTASRTAELWSVREVPCPAAVWPGSDRVIWWQLEQIGRRFRAANVAQLIPTGHRPPIMRKSVTGLMPYRYKIALGEGEDKSLRGTSGFEAYHYLTPSGNVWLMVPSLNFFSVLQQTLEGRRELYSNIRIVPQAPELFEPPAGAVVNAKEVPAGIVSEPPDAVAHPYHGNAKWGTD